MTLKMACFLTICRNPSTAWHITKWWILIFEKKIINLQKEDEKIALNMKYFSMVVDELAFW